MTTDVKSRHTPEPDGANVCPECGHDDLETHWSNCPILYGAAPHTVQLDVRLPVRKCRKCGFEFFDEEAEDLRHEAVCRHLGVLTPAEIIALRNKLGLSRAEFARLTGLGDATIARWERAELIQNAGYDSLLWLLREDEKNVQRLRKRAENSGDPIVLRKADPKDAKLREQARDFKVA